LFEFDRRGTMFGLVADPSSRSFLRWAGSKRQLTPILQRHSPVVYRRYVEPFAGSACLFFKTRPERALLGDINGELIRTYLEVKWRVGGVIAALGLLYKSKDKYLELRAIDPDKLDSSARAARFIYLNRCCFNGLYRTNTKGQFNVPYGGQKSGALPSEDLLRACSRALKGAKLVGKDFEDVLTEVTDGDFVYMDPPFSVRAKRTFREYDAALFGEAQIKRLRQWMEYFAAREIPFLVSYASSDEADFLRNGFRSRRVAVRRNISGFTTTRATSGEVLIYPDNLQHSQLN
jgi:DNA adenine methylase